MELFTMALGLEKPWNVTKAEFIDKENSTKELHLWLDFTPGYKFSIDGSRPAVAHDTLDKTWRHLNFFNINAIYMPVFLASGSVTMK